MNRPLVGYKSDSGARSAIEKKVNALQVLRRAELLARWQRAFGRPAPKRISRELLLLTLAYQIQERAEGGLSKAARKRLSGRGGADGGVTPPPRSRAPRLKPGSRLIREWHGEVHQVTVRDAGFEYRGESYRSLSQIARTITGTRWSGPSFFGLRKAAGQWGASR